jgi:hypothetical protein
MNKLLFLLAMSGMAITLHVHGQGQFVFYNLSAPTRLVSIDGPLAGPGIWAEMLAGRTPDRLSPLGFPAQHFGDGLVVGFNLTVQGIDCFETAYIQMVAWDGRLWGTSLEGVPADQLGRTDIVPHMLTCYPLPVYSPMFTQPAIVPIPEPSVVMLGILAGSLAFVGRFARRQLRHSK